MQYVRRLRGSVYATSLDSQFLSSYQLPDAVLPSAAVQVLLWRAALLVEFNSAVADVVVAGTPPDTYRSSLKN